MKRPHMFPFGLMILLSVMTFALQNIIELFPIHSVPNSPNTVEYSVEKFSARTFNTNGKIEYAARGEKMWKFPQKPEIFAENLHLTAYFRGKPDAEIKSQYARYDQTSELAYLNGTVFAQRFARRGIEAMQLEATELSFNHKTRLLSSSQPARLTRADGSTLHADQFTYHEPSGKLQLASNNPQNRVKIIHAPLQKPN